MNRPFDAARYAGLLKGLEVSEILLSKLENTFTIGAEYYAPAFLRPYKALLASSYEKKALKAICSLITDGDHGSADYAEQGVPFVLSEAVRIGWVNVDSCRFITKRHAATLSRSTLRTGDVLVSKTGVYFGRSAVVPIELAGANTIAHVGILRPRKGIDPYFLSMFLNSAYGYSQLRRRGIKATRPEIKLLEFDDITVPLVSERFSRAIRDATLVAADIRLGAHQQVVAAESGLLTPLGLARHQPSEPLSYIRRSREAFAAGRLDAEYFSPATHAILEELSRQGDIALGEVCKVATGFPWQSDQFIERGSGAGDPFVRIRDCKPSAIWADELDMLEASYAAAQSQPKAQPGNLVVGMDGLKWFYASQLMDACHVNQRVAWLVPRNETYPSEYLMTVINALVGQRQLLSNMTIAHTVGHITLEDLRNMRVPVLTSQLRDQIAKLARRAITDKQRATQLLDATRRAVEIAIEDSETAALAWLQDARAKVEGAP